MRVIGLLGGTFDPVHHGHLRIAYELKQGLKLDELSFIPCADPPHKKSTSATAEQRAEMLRLAISGISEFVVDTREFNRQGPSYTIDTLREIRAEMGSSVSICWIVGSDSFQALDTWHEWEKLLDFAHFIVACRPGWHPDADSAMGQILAGHFIDDPVKLQQTQAGYIMPCQVTQLAISATEIRDGVKRGESPRFLVPDSVADYIENKGLYRQ